ncbi:hypothetical protein SKAU_G00394770 [Synaphobranchus kaupii]|uniref:Uncharacterized protein n=1 Tax=Synaphobranchus kaupii TaxID=118154 RepID=A0A9Q1IDZ1_SYNKA|nr:hypothetical protein SKAU_G00394770 [Synaphobranchus kaupii]
MFSDFFCDGFAAHRSWRATPLEVQDENPPTGVFRRPRQSVRQEVSPQGLSGVWLHLDIKRVGKARETDVGVKRAVLSQTPLQGDVRFTRARIFSNGPWKEEANFNSHRIASTSHSLHKDGYLRPPPPPLSAPRGPPAHTRGHRTGGAALFYRAVHRRRDARLTTGALHAIAVGGGIGFDTAAKGHIAAREGNTFAE